MGHIKDRHVLYATINFNKTA